MLLNQTLKHPQLRHWMNLPIESTFMVLELGTLFVAPKGRNTSPHRDKLRPLAFRAGRRDLGGHGAGEMFDVAAVGATPAHAAQLVVGFEPLQRAVEAVAHL